MKVFHYEAGREVVYVQLQDIMYLISTNDTIIPSSIFEEIFKEKIFDTTSRFEFIKFIKDEEVIFFKKLTFIINYDEYSLNYEETFNKVLEMEEEKKEKIMEFNNLCEKDKRKNERLFTEVCNIEHALDDILQIVWERQGIKEIPFPKSINKKKNRKKKSEI